MVNLKSIGGIVLILCSIHTWAETTDSIAQRPDHINNAESKFFPAVFNQDGGSCGSASRIGYMFTHEINAFRGADASKPENVYPTHFTWLLTNSNSGKEVMARANGVPNSIVYGGSTYSKLFGNQDCSSKEFGWMQGYDKWYSAMFNRISHNSFSPYGLDTEKGREYIKNWLWNHQGDKDFHIGGICGIGVASACKQGTIADDPEGINKSIGLVDKKYVTRWGDGVDHALTIVGYDDRIVFDLDSNKVYGEKDKDERGAWIIVNSWGNRWANEGFIYCPYKYGFPVRQHEGGAWRPEFYHVRKNYRPLRTFKIRMDYSHRSELKLIAGISTNLKADKPDIYIEMEHFKFAGDGRSAKDKNGHEAPTPMLGKWADGKLHSEPMEFGYDLTDLSSGFDTRRPLKYFFIIEKKKGAEGSGKVYTCSVIDYEFDRKGIETPVISSEVEIDSTENETVMASTVQGEPLFAPLNVSFTDNHLIWDKPQRSHYNLEGYVLYKNNNPIDTISSDKKYISLNTNEDYYTLSALYKVNDSTYMESVKTKSVCPKVIQYCESSSLQMNGNQLTIPNIFTQKNEKITIEYWIKPYFWNPNTQYIGSRPGEFTISATHDGAVVAGWDYANAITTRKNLIVANKWYHFAIVVDDNNLTLYVNGKEEGKLKSEKYSGINKMRNFSFGINGKNKLMDCELKDVRIWNEARTEKEIKECMYISFNSKVLPDNLVAYYKGDVIKDNGKYSWRDFAGVNHAVIKDTCNYKVLNQKDMYCKNKSKELKADFNLPEDSIYVGKAFDVPAILSDNISSVEWSAKGSDMKKIDNKIATFIFDGKGKKKITLTARNESGKKIKVSKELYVLPYKKPEAEFKPIRNEILAGERISFHPVNAIPGYKYEWSMQGSDTEKSTTQNAAATYERSGTYNVELTVTNPENMDKAKSMQQIYVKNVVPEIAFDISPMVIHKGDFVNLTDKSRFIPTEWKWKIQSKVFTETAEGKNPRIKMMHPGVYDVTLTATNEIGSSESTRKNLLIVCNADSKNGLNFSNPVSEIQTEKTVCNNKSNNELTIEWWMNPSSKGNISGIGYDKGTWQITGYNNGRMTLFVDSIGVSTKNGFILPGQWHHYAVSFNKGEVKFIRDGEIIHTATVKNKKRTVTSIPVVPFLRIGGKEFPMNAVIDEFRVWNKALDEDTIREYCNIPINNIQEAENTHKLTLYYSFNQNGGDVKDSTSNNNSGTRKGFGPDGDAWGHSFGVFSLNYE